MAKSTVGEEHALARLAQGALEKACQEKMEAKLGWCQVQAKEQQLNRKQWSLEAIKKVGADLAAKRAFQGRLERLEGPF